MAKAFLLYLSLIVALGVAGGFGLRQYFAKSNKPSAYETASLGYSPLFYRSIGQIPTLPEKTEREEYEKKFTLELRTFQTEREAQKHVDSLGKVGVATYYTPTRQGDRVVFKVRMGLFKDLSSAQQFAKKLKDESKMNSSLVELF